ncbi:hypothetical protein [Chryseobacterium indologenes]|uniref:Uncharacterized protein n=1 Tax=Chryseobacterium indologenes TaxID=253 RepID=A0A0N0ZV98_CHRID|nr:hypothetical protein [Chryseobacterium indologenes]KPE51058.1 hypothetical protein AOB46_10290 [Chryseobacterium indologenes]
MKRAYYYFFTEIYKSVEYTSDLLGGKFLTSFKASIVMVALETWWLMSLGAYYSIHTKTAIELSISMPIIYIPLIIIILFNYLTIDYNSAWKKYNSDFDNLPKNKNRIGSWLVLGIVIFIILNFIYSIYLMSQIDWSQYR